MASGGKWQRLSGSGYSIESCNNECNKTDWCKQFEMNNSNGQCELLSAGCSQAGSGWKNYKPVGGILDLVLDN